MTINFSAGPAVLPEEVLSRAGDEMLDWRGTGMCVMEMSHRGKEFMSIAAEAEKDLRELLAIPQNYKVLFLQGGATLQFAQIPMNLLAGKGKADYVVGTEYRRQQGLAGTGNSLGVFLSTNLHVFNRNQGEIERARREESQAGARMQALQALYRLPASAFHDITSGYNGTSARPGYDQVTGRGSPVANVLVPDLVS